MQLFFLLLCYNESCESQKMQHIKMITKKMRGERKGVVEVVNHFKQQNHKKNILTSG